MRGLLVTPWFAAGAGFVIAAARALNSPHTVLTYRPNNQPCSICTRPTPEPGSLASATPGVKIKRAKPAPTGHASKSTGRGSTAGPEVGFRVVWRKNGEFGAIVTIAARQARQGWSLQFAIPGTRITQVWGAQWQSAPGAHGGLARMLTSQPGQPGHSYSPGPGQHGLTSAQGNQGGWQPDNVRFLVVAVGNPRVPDGCVLNRVTCHFG
jgi:hypothetical protein